MDFLFDSALARAPRDVCHACVRRCAFEPWRWSTEHCCVALTTPIESMSVHLARGRIEGADAAQRRKSGFVAQSRGIVSGRDE